MFGRYPLVEDCQSYAAQGATPQARRFFNITTNVRSCICRLDRVLSHVGCDWIDCPPCRFVFLFGL
jgi:hypothetical protein